MGTWSVTLYGSDAAADIRSDVKELLRAPMDESEIVAALTDAYPSLANPRDEEYSDLCLAQCAAAMIEADLSILDQQLGEKPRLAVGGGRLTPLFERKMRFEVVGHLQPDPQAIRADFDAFFASTFVPAVVLADLLTGCIGTRNPSRVPLSRYARP